MWGEGHPGGRRSNGRPRKSWFRDVAEDLIEMGIRTWTMLAMLLMAILALSVCTKERKKIRRNREK